MKKSKASQKQVASKSVEDDRPVSAIHIEESVIDDDAPDGNAHSKLTKPVEELCSHSQNIMTDLKEIKDHLLSPFLLKIFPRPSFILISNSV